jgi:iron only hydrogenase large subunit-like protein
MNLEADLLPSEEDTSELDFNLSTQELSDAIDLLDAKLAEEPPKAPPSEGNVSEPAALRSEELETALESVIRKMFGEKIDHLLNEAIEKTVSAEIARLKEQLLGDAPEEP